jgi:hypothetical protein
VKRLGITSGQACTLLLGFLLAVVLLVVSLPAVWDGPGSSPSTDQEIRP